MAAPKRIRRSRARGWRMPEGAVYVGRGTKSTSVQVVDCGAQQVDAVLEHPQARIALIAQRASVFDALKGVIVVPPESFGRSADVASRAHLRFLRGAVSDLVGLGARVGLGAAPESFTSIPRCYPGRAADCANPSAVVSVYLRESVSEFRGWFAALKFARSELSVVARDAEPARSHRFSTTRFRAYPGLLTRDNRHV